MPMATQVTVTEEDSARVYAMQLTFTLALPMVLKTTVELGLLDTIANAGPDVQLSSSKIASLIPMLNPEVSSSMIDRILTLLASFSIVTCSLSSNDEKGGKTTRVYGLAPAGRFFVRGGGQGSLASLLKLSSSPNSMQAWQCLKESVVEGGVAFIKAKGMSAFQYMSVDPKFNSLFNEAMADFTSFSMKKVIDVYQGFEGVHVLVDVGGGNGALLNTIITKHPNIKGINFDQPQVVEHAPSYASIQHVGGNMFEKVPNGDAILLRKVIHNWDDEHCVKILKKCYEALEDDGKIIIIDSVLPLIPETSDACKHAVQMDVLMMAIFGGGKERTEEEFKAISTAAGFTRFQLVCSVNGDSVIELEK